jgi:hypothetical protein
MIEPVPIRDLFNMSISDLEDALEDYTETFDAVMDDIY